MLNNYDENFLSLVINYSNGYKLVFEENFDELYLMVNKNFTKNNFEIIIVNNIHDEIDFIFLKELCTKYNNIRILSVEEIVDNEALFSIGLASSIGDLIITIDMYGRELYLLNRCNRKYEDIGGKTDAVDHSAVSTAVRECCEECNYNLFGIERSSDCKEMLYQHLLNCRTQEIYNRKSKYLLFKVYVDPTILNLNMKRFKLTEL